MKPETVHLARSQLLSQLLALSGLGLVADCIHLHVVSGRRTFSQRGLLPPALSSAL